MINYVNIFVLTDVPRHLLGKPMKILQKQKSFRCVFKATPLSHILIDLERFEIICMLSEQII